MVFHTTIHWHGFQGKRRSRRSRLFGARTRPHSQHRRLLAVTTVMLRVSRWPFGTDSGAAPAPVRVPDCFYDKAINVDLLNIMGLNRQVQPVPFGEFESYKQFGKPCTLVGLFAPPSDVVVVKDAYSDPVTWSVVPPDGTLVFVCDVYDTRTSRAGRVRFVRTTEAQEVLAAIADLKRVLLDTAKPGATPSTCPATSLA